MATTRYSAVLFSSLIVAAIATFLVFRYIDASTAQNQIATVSVVVAVKDIPEGAEVNEVDVRVEQWPEPVVPEKAFTSVARVSGRVTSVPVYAGEAILAGRLAPEGTTPGLEARIAPGKRAMGVRINDVSGMNGMIQPNSRVDILVMLSRENSDGQRMAKMFMENMRVLGIGTEVTRGADGRVTPSTVAMIEVTPEEAERLGAAAAAGQIQLVLRGFADPVAASANGATNGDLTLRTVEAPAPRSTPPRPAPRPVAPPAQPAVESPPSAPPPKTAQKPESLTIRVWRGLKRSDEKLKKDTLKADSSST